MITNTHIRVSTLTKNHVDNIQRHLSLKLSRKVTADETVYRMAREFEKQGIPANVSMGRLARTDEIPLGKTHTARIAKGGK